MSMLNRRLSLHGLFAVLLALMAQLGIGATVPQADPIAVIADFGAICHATGDAGGTPDHTPAHPVDCLACPLCLAVHAPAVALIARGVTPVPPAAVLVRRVELPPPSTAPPSLHWPPNQPRAPPAVS